MRCKRCGSTISYDDVMCKGCGKSLVDLKAKDEIEFDDNATINIEPIKKVDTPSVVVEEPKVTDIFGDAMYKQENIENEKINSVAEVSNIETINADVEVGNVDVEPTNSVEFEEEKINTEPIIQNERTEVVEFNNDIEHIEQEKVNDTKLADIENKNQENMSSLNISETKVVTDSIPKKKSKKWLLIVIITLILAIVATIIFIFTKTAPKSIFETSVTKLFSYGNLETLNTPVSKSEMYLKLNIEDAKQNSTYDIINNLNIGLTTHIDKPNKKMLISFDSKYGNSDLLKATIYGSNNKLYGLLNNIYERYIGIDIDEEMYNKFFEDNDYLDEFKVILEQLNKEINNSFDKKYFKRAIKGTDVISTLTLSQNDYKEFTKKLVSNIKNNEKIINGIATITNSEISTIKKEIEESNSEVYEGIEIKVDITSGILEGAVKKIQLSIGDGHDKFTLDIDVVGKSKYNFILKANEDTINGSLNIEKKNGFNEYSFTINDNEMGKVTYTIGYKVSSDQALVLPDLSDTTNYEEMTTEEMELILTNLFQNEGIMKLYEAYNEIYPEYPEESLYPEEYDYYIPEDLEI